MANKTTRQDTIEFPPVNVEIMVEQLKANRLLRNEVEVSKFEQAHFNIRRSQKSLGDIFVALMQGLDDQSQNDFYTGLVTDYLHKNYDDLVKVFTGFVRESTNINEVARGWIKQIISYINGSTSRRLAFSTALLESDEAQHLYFVDVLCEMIEEWRKEKNVSESSIRGIEFFLYVIMNKEIPNEEEFIYKYLDEQRDQNFCWKKYQNKRVVSLV